MEIYGTLGPSCATRAVLADMFRAGMTGIRLNLSHSSLRESARQLEVLRSAAADAGIEPMLLIDMQGPELRIGSLRAPLMLCENEEVQYYSKELPEEERQKIRRKGRAIPVPGVACDVLEKGTEILLDDGRFLLRITETADGGSRGMAMVVRGGMLSGDKSIKVIGAEIEPPTMTGADLRNIRDAAEFGVTGVMQPFVRSRADLETVRRTLDENGAGHLQLIAKIENRAGMQQLDSLLPACDSICIARGDLGNDMDLWTLPAAQKEIAAACRAAGRSFMVATQMLSSMEKCAVPTRAEVNDIFNTAADGAAGVMVTGETAVGKYPVEVIRFLARTAAEGEAYRDRAGS